MDNPLVDSLLKKITESQTESHHPLARKHHSNYLAANDNAINSMSPTPAMDGFEAAFPKIRPGATTGKENYASDGELTRLQQQLAAAQSKISQLQEIHQTSEPKADFARVMPFDTSYADGNFRFPGPANLPLGHTPTMNNSWSGYDDSRSDTSDALSATGFNRARHIWNGPKPDQLPGVGFSDANLPGNVPGIANPWGPRGSNTGYLDSGMSYNAAPGPGPEPLRSVDRVSPDYDMTIRGPNRRNGRVDRFGYPAYGAPGSYGAGNNFNQFGHGPYDSAPAHGNQYAMSTTSYSSHQPSAIGTPLSPLATEFTAGTGPWKTEPTTVDGPTYLPTTEPLNYRRLLDRNVNCNWKYIVDKIVCNNDQQASIFLQQKLKVGTPDQKYEIVDAIILQAHPLMVNRFGNFLVQRCFEHGTPEQVIKIAEAIRGNTLSLSMDPFGCHVVQKAFDSVPEDYKAVMVHELLRRIPETVIHRYACHVWQKLFELRWSESPPQIMKYVNEALRGMWHEVALGETGSLVVQNIFENCLEEDKRPCIEEVLANIDIVAHGQFGNWCIQHICEHSAPADRSRAIDHVIRFAAEYSMDQYASKVVKKCLKIGGGEFLSRYLDRVCEGRVDRPRIPLIDIASDQYGNYLIQWILTQANSQHREVVAAHIRKHMVSLRGSKFGSRVGMLCTNPAVATRPGPGVNNLGRMPGPRYPRSFQ
ncbi:armadillo-type protein [Truncatella angustata]|uniref:Armadillo-type protein n=1 Tax=Truncatella angustata TaxID=152316 RepID=A0A9P8RKT3_9PEZI|nr:armadillo-type protein [Truncatella angustata]KAH6645886.1 armadillo-type protein [Truncatella angustata]